MIKSPTPFDPHGLSPGKHVAMLREIGMPELIAQDRQDYLRIALRLGKDAEWNAQIRAEMVKKVDRLFGNKAPIRELERFLVSCFS